MTRNPVTIDASTTMAAAREVMTDTLVRHLPVVDDGKLVGALSERELDLVEALAEFTPDELLVRREPLVLSPKTPAHTVLPEMGDHRAGSAVVVDDEGTIVGIFAVVGAIDALADAIA